MGTRKRHSAPVVAAPRRHQSGAVRIDDRIRLGHAIATSLEPFGVGVAIVEPRTSRFVFVSEALTALLGATREDLLALPSAVERFAKDDARAAEAYLEQTRATRAHLRLVHADGTLVEVELSARRFDEDDGDRALAIVVRDAREGVGREEMRRAIDVATDALRARDELFSIAAHDLKTPLTSLRLHAQALQRSLYRDPTDPTRARKSIDVIERHAERMAFLIDQLLDVARIHGGRLEIEPLPADLGSIVREVAARFGPEVASRGATIIIDGERSVPGRWDPLRLDQIVTNLVSNALKYGDGKPIVLELRANNARAQLTVRDYGPGIPEDHQARIFEPFERATSDARLRGAGLGLWIVRRLVEAHGGEVSVASVVGKGAVFVVDLPRHA
jgi:PAS domain S-box-containing protein